MTDTGTSQGVGVPGSISVRVARVMAFVPADAAGWTVLVFSVGTILSAALQRHLLEDTQTAQHLVEFNVGEAFGLAAILALVLARADTGSAESAPRQRLRAVRDGDAIGPGSQQVSQRWPPALRGKSAAHQGPNRTKRWPADASLLSPRRHPSLAGSDVAVLLLSALAWFAPEQHGVYLATTIAGAWFLSTSRSNRQMAGIGQIWLALSVYELWGKLLFKLFYQSIEVVEVELIYKVGRLFYGGLGLAGASLSVRDDWAIVVLEGCSSFHNLSLAVLIWLSILKIADQRLSLAAVRALGVSACLVVAVNVTRILLMLPSREAYIFWHDGEGSSLVALTSVLAVIVPVLLCAEEDACRPSPCK